MQLWRGYKSHAMGGQAPALVRCVGTITGSDLLCDNPATGSQPQPKLQAFMLLTT